ncbi:hypothetical protein BCR33DRAFT_728059, partial [Rhizoclosmatium globosum]
MANNDGTLTILIVCEEATRSHVVPYFEALQLLHLRGHRIVFGSNHENRPKSQIFSNGRQHARKKREPGRLAPLTERVSKTHAIPLGVEPNVNMNGI